MVISQRISQLVDDPVHGGGHSKRTAREAHFAAKLVVDKRTVYRWTLRPDAKGATTPSLAQAQKIHRATGVSLDWLVGLAERSEDRIAESAAYARYRVEDVSELLRNVRAKLDAIDGAADQGVPAPKPVDMPAAPSAPSARHRPRRRQTGKRGAK